MTYITDCLLYRFLARNKLIKRNLNDVVGEMLGQNVLKFFSRRFVDKTDLESNDKE